MVVAKKVAKRSVDRNYMRRVLRELFRKQQMQIAAFDLVIRVMKPFNHQDFAQMEQEFAELLFRLKRATAMDTTVTQSEPHHV